MLNKENWNKAFEILKSNSNIGSEGGGITHFNSLTLQGALTLLENKFLDPEERQNLAPTVNDMIEFIKANFPDKIGFHGYIVSPRREDVRISFEGINNLSNSTFTKKELETIFNFFDYADELKLARKSIWVWYD